MQYPRSALDRLALAKRLTLAANASVQEVLAGLIAPTEHAARRVGITGPPGAGKSSLVSLLCQRWLARQRRVGVVAIDPSSPFTSGAILGDRIRMESVAAHPNVFIRSLASRSAHDGLTDNLPEILLTMDSFDFDDVIVETVGVGQIETAVRDLVDTTVLVLNPESGDQVQAMKAGIFEAADVIVVNKADLPGADKIAAALAHVVAVAKTSMQTWVPTVLTASCRDTVGLEAIDDALARHLVWRQTHQHPDELQRRRYALHLRMLLLRRIAEIMEQRPPEPLAGSLHAAFDQLLRDCQVTPRDPDIR